MGAFCDLSGERFGRLTVLKRADDKILKNGRKILSYLCICDCGNETVVAAQKLRDGSTQSCGCLSREKAKASIKNAGKATLSNKKWKRSQLVGKKFGRLTVASISGKGKCGQYYATCECDCGKTVNVNINSLKDGTSTKCVECRLMEFSQKYKESELVDGTALCHLTQKNRRDNSTGVKGVYLDKRNGKFVAEIKLRGKKYWLGQYSTLDEARKARELAEEKIFDPVLEANGRKTTAELRDCP